MKLSRRRDRRFFVSTEALESRDLLAVSLSIDYSLDTSGFFTSATRQVLQNTLNSIVSRFNDTLSAVSTDTYTIRYGDSGATRNVTTSVAANTLKLYAFGAPLGGSTTGRGGPVYSSGSTHRGQGANDFAPLISTLMFDSDGSTNWHLGSTTSGLTSSKTDFVTVATHEFLHALGLVGQPTFNRYHSGNTFTGPNARAANGGNVVPLEPGSIHVGEDIDSVFNAALFDGTRKEMGPLEYAMLRDIGWSVNVPSASGFYRRDLLTNGADGSARLTVFPARGVYMNRIDALTGDSLVITTRDGSASNQAGVDTYLKLYNSAGDLLDSDDDGNGGNKSKITYTIPVGGTYYIGASTYSNRDFSYETTSILSPSSTNQFILDVSLRRWGITQPDRAYEVTSFLNPSERAITIHSTIGSADGQRFYGLNAIAGRTYSISTSLPAVGGLANKAIITVYDPSGNRVAGMSGSTNYGNVTFRATRSGRYYVSVAANPGGATTRLFPGEDEIDIDSGWTSLSADRELYRGGSSRTGADYRISFSSRAASTPGDYDGDGKTDLVVYLPDVAVFAYKPSAGGADVLVQFGPAGRSVAAPGDYDGDGISDIAVYIPDVSVFAYRPSSGGPDVVYQFGPAGLSFAAPGDYDGDGKTDFAVFLPGPAVFGYKPSRGGTDVLQQFGPGGGRCVASPGDYDGDGKTDFAVFLADVAVFAFKPSAGGVDVLQQFGPGGYISQSVAGDYDGDGKADFAVFMPDAAVFGYKPSGGGVDFIKQFGPAGRRSKAVLKPIGFV